MNSTNLLLHLSKNITVRLASKSPPKILKGLQIMHL